MQFHINYSASLQKREYEKINQRASFSDYSHALGVQLKHEKFTKEHADNRFLCYFKIFFTDVREKKKKAFTTEEEERVP